jgi:hypothetical protein
VKRSFSDGTDPDLIALGSPQLSAEELRAIARRLERRTPRIPVWVFTSRLVKEDNAEAVATIEGHGGRVLADTCLEVTLLEDRIKTVATPSGKGAYYLPSLSKQRVILDDIDALLERYARNCADAGSLEAVSPEKRLQSMFRSPLSEERTRRPVPSSIRPVASRDNEWPVESLRSRMGRAARSARTSSMGWRNVEWDPRAW